MKTGLYSFVTIVTILFAASSCYYDNEETLYPDLKQCDTSNVTFRNSVTRMLADNCLACHSNSQAALNGNNVKLENYADVVSNAARVSGAIKHLPSFSPMPKNGGRLNSCLIRQFDIWVEKGTPDN
jgi:hypothetical protein